MCCIIGNAPDIVRRPNYRLQLIWAKWHAYVNWVFIGSSNGWTVLTHYSALHIYRGHFSPNNLRKTPITCTLGRDMGVCHEFQFWPKFNIGSNCAVCNTAWYCTPIFQWILTKLTGITDFEIVVGKLSATILPAPKCQGVSWLLWGHGLIVIKVIYLLVNYQTHFV